VRPSKQCGTGEFHKWAGFGLPVQNLRSIHFHVPPLTDKAKKLPGTDTGSSPAVTHTAASEFSEPLKDAVLTTALDGVITHCNMGLSRYGYGPENLVGISLQDLFSPESQSVLAKLVIPTVREKGRCEATLHGRTRRGEEYAVHLRLSLLRDGSAIPTGMVAVASEVTENKRQPGGRDTARRVIDGTEFLIASPVMHKFMGMVDRVAGHTETVLVVGETGTGKELVARTIHESSYRHNKLLVDINCAALPEHLVESELFGYEKGAFSGADSSKPGLFELADHSTIFLDEIGELQPQIQVKLLRVLDGAPYYRLGGHRKISVDVRVVAATNQDLEAAVKEGRFRKDLFHRLSQFQLRVPPLRERPEDIATLAQHFLALKTPDKTFSADAISAMQAYPWPGNIRELRNSVAKLAMSGAGAEITATEVSGELRQEGTPALPVRRTMPQGNLENMEEQMIIQALEQTGGHKTQAAEQLGISRRTLTRKLREYGIDANVGDGAASLGILSQEQQKFFRAKVSISVALRNAAGKETQAQAINLSTGGMGLESINDPAGFAGVLDVSFLLPDSETVMHAKGRLVWADVGGRAGLRFVVVEPELFQHLQRWTNEKMKNEGWELPS